ncbi:AfsR/SARP family transcriptional regulator [Micromonospora narathiwatensis]|uniref:DNA-binding transcriptional activator of the SARP family n=1 Tax=Micromonospora narathiwatensis TaxID=299146 RepID=A0A1A8ZHG2_9ACTN|nr:BTAD domain-containing putative transcriptional regulator [Micromonospora narathiwatensis]SBT43310.1 DNA-binding transcriptional activator of the SARP family [Micromonospora narathiwatensis]
MRQLQESLCLAVLGPMRAWRHGDEITLGPPKQRAVLGLLASRVNDVVGFEEIIDAVWGNEVPPTAANGVHTYIAGLRRVIEPGRSRRDLGEVLVSTGGGYALFMDPDALDTTLFAAEGRRARRLREAGDGAGAAEIYHAALRLWRGEAYFGVPGPFAAVERTRLHELRLSVVEELAELLLELHRPADAVTVLSEAVAKEPLREKLRGLLMLSLYRGGRQADALSLYRETRQLLLEELGIEPVPELRDLHNQILVGHPDLDDPVPAEPTTEGPAGVEPRQGDLRRPAQLPCRPRGFAGRAAELGRLRELVERDQRCPGTTTVAVLEGGAGTGKTALTVELAHEIAAGFPDGQLFVDLRGSARDGGSLSALDALGFALASLGVERGRVPGDLSAASALYRSLLHGRRMLVVLDDAADAEQVRQLIPGGPACVLVTSRRRQRGLAARDGAYRLALGPVSTTEATDLLANLAGAGRLVGREQEVAELAELCGHLPLALRIAAGALAAEPGLTPAELVRRYRLPHTRLDQLAVRGDASTDVRAALAATYDALPPETARAFRMLGCCPSTAITTQMAAALAGLTHPEAHHQLQVLVDHHLLDEVSGCLHRFPPLVRIYASECSELETRASRMAALGRMLGLRRREESVPQFEETAA